MPLHRSYELPLGPTPSCGDTPAGLPSPTAAILAARRVVGPIVARYAMSITAAPRSVSDTVRDHCAVGTPYRPQCPRFEFGPRRSGSPTSLPASPRCRTPVCMSCCPGTGKPPATRAWPHRPALPSHFAFEPPGPAGSDLTSCGPHRRVTGEGARVEEHAGPCQFGPTGPKLRKVRHAQAVVMQGLRNAFGAIWSGNTPGSWYQKKAE